MADHTDKSDIVTVFNTIERKLRVEFGKDTTGHDFYHLMRVHNLALHLQSTEGGDLLVVGMAALVHDVHRLMQSEEGRYFSPEESLDRVEVIIKSAALERTAVERVLHCVRYHEQYSFSPTGKTVADVETLILQDADNLEAMGAIGLARTFTYGAVHGRPIWLPEIPLERDHYEEGEPIDPSTVHHIYSKLLRLKDNMNTRSGRHFAERRHGVLLRFLEDFRKEWEGHR